MPTHLADLVRLDTGILHRHLTSLDRCPTKNHPLRRCPPLSSVQIRWDFDVCPNRNHLLSIATFPVCQSPDTAVWRVNQQWPFGLAVPLRISDCHSIDRRWTFSVWHMTWPRAQLTRTRFDAICTFANSFLAEAFFCQFDSPLIDFISLYLALIVTFCSILGSYCYSIVSFVIVGLSSSIHCLVWKINKSEKSLENITKVLR